MSNAVITATGTYSWKVYINMLFFKIVSKRETKPFVITKKVPLANKDAVIGINSAVSIHLNWDGHSLNANVLFANMVVKQFIFPLDALVNDYTIKIPDVTWKGDTLTGTTIKINIVD